MKRQVNAPAKFIDRWSGRILGRLLGGIARALGRFGSPRLDAPPRRILLVKFCCMGDAVLIEPALRALRRTFPAAHVTMVCTPRTLPIFEGSELLNEVLRFPLTGSRGLGEFLTHGLPGLFAMLGRLRRQPYDVAIDFDNYYNWTTFLPFAAGVRTRVGFDTPGQGRSNLLTNPVPYAGEKHMVEFYLDLVRAIGADTPDRSPVFHLPAESHAWARTFLAAAGHARGEQPLVALSPGRSEAWHFIRWAEDNFVATGAALHERFGARLLLVGGPAERAISERMVAALRARGIAAIDAVGRSDLRQSAALLAECDLLVCNDSGPMHVAAAVGTPTLAIFGPTSHKLWGPYGPEHRVARLDLDCSPCLILGKLGVCPRQLLECLGTPVGQVIALATGMMESRGSARPVGPGNERAVHPGSS